jgi:hypothetical protein
MKIIEFLCELIISSKKGDESECFLLGEMKEAELGRHLLLLIEKFYLNSGLQGKINGIYSFISAQNTDLLQRIEKRKKAEEEKAAKIVKDKEAKEAKEEKEAKEAKDKEVQEEQEAKEAKDKEAQGEKEAKEAKEKEEAKSQVEEEAESNDKKAEEAKTTEEHVEAPSEEAEKANSKNAEESSSKTLQNTPEEADENTEEPKNTENPQPLKKEEKEDVSAKQTNLEEEKEEEQNLETKQQYLIQYFTIFIKDCDLLSYILDAYANRFILTPANNTIINPNRAIVFKLANILHSFANHHLITQYLESKNIPAFYFNQSAL